MNRHDVYKLIDGEREYQDRVWGGKEHDERHSVEEWLGFIGRYVIQAGIRPRPDETSNDAFVHSMTCVRKIAALAVACMERLPTPAREQLPSQEVLTLRATADQLHRKVDILEDALDTFSKHCETRAHTARDRGQPVLADEMRQLSTVAREKLLEAQSL